MAEMVINVTQSVNPSFGHIWGVPLVYNGQYGSGWVAFVGGYGLQFSGQTTVQTDLDGNPIGFTVTLDGAFTVFTNGAVVGSGTMPPFIYTSALSGGDYAVPDGNGGWQLGVHGSPSGATTPLGPFGEFIAALDRIAYNGSSGDDVFDGSHVDTSVLIHGGDGTDTLYGAFRRANELYGQDGNDVLWGQGVGDYVDGGAGNDFVFDGDSAGDPTIPTPPQDTYNADTLIGGDGDDQVLSSGGGDLLDGGAGNDYLQASSDRQDDDTLIGGIGDDQINGGLGTDTAVFSGLRSQYTVTGVNIGLGACSIVGPDGSDTLYNIENLRFDDGTYSITQFGNGSGSSPAPAVFGSPITYQAGFGTSDVVAADINGDSIVDLLAANHAGGSVSVLLGQGGGQFASAVNYSMSGGPIDIELGDLNGDGILDLVAASPFSNSITVRVGTGAGTFLSEASYPTGIGPRGVVIGDFNHDGNLDAAAAHANGSDLSVLLGTGTGSFAPAVQYGVGGSFPWPIDTADLNKDGNLDLITARNFVSVLMGSPDGTFSAPATYPAAGHDIISFAVDDLDNDGNLDLVTANRGTNDVSVMFGTGTGDFLPEVRYAVGAGPYAIAIGDVNGDGQLDVGTANSVDDTISVLLNAGSGTFGPQQVFASGGDNPAAIDFSDVNGDSRMDIVVGNYDSGNVSVLLNNQLTITSDGGGVTASRTMAENSYDVTTVVAIGGIANGTLSYSIVGGADQAEFQIDETSGVLRFVASPDFEAPSDEDVNNIYEVVVQASDGQGGIDTQMVTVNVSNTNDNAPVFSSGSIANFAENVTGTVYDADATDADNPGSLTYSLSGADEALFDIDAMGIVTFKNTPDFENPADADGNNIYDIVVTASDGVLATNRDVAISVVNANESQDDILLSSSTVNEFASDGTLVGTLSAVDPDIGDLHSFVLLDDAGGRFGLLNGNQLVVANGVALDYEQSSGHQVTIHATDEGGHSIDRTFTINVSDINPELVTGTTGDDVIYGGGENDSLDGNNGNDTLVGGLGNDSIQGSDGFDTAVFKGDFASYAITQGAPNGFGYTIAGPDGTDYIANIERFVFDDRNIDAIVFGTPNDDAVLQAPTSDDVLYGEAGNDWLFGNFGNDVLFGGDGDDFLAGQYDVDVLTGGSGKDTYSGSTSDWIGDRITDYEYGEDILVYGGPVAAAAYRLQVGNGDTYLEMDADLDGSFDTLLTLSGTIQGSVSVGTWDQPDYARLAIAASNGLPSITSGGGGDTATLSINENTSGVTTVVAVDPDADDSLTYSIIGGADAALFAIDAVTGAIGFLAAPDFELPTDADGDNVYEAMVQVSDGKGGVDTQTISMSVTNAPGGTFNGNGSNNIVVGTDEEDTIRGNGGSDTLTGLAGPDLIDGGSGDDLLNGGEGDDTLLGGIGRDRLDGGAGGDNMDGGAGNDTYVVREESDVVTELAGAGTDTVETTLAAYEIGANVENLVYVGSGNFQGTGNSLANTITGGNGDDILDGTGGADRLVGRGGDDTYMVDSASDAAVEAVGGGRDTVYVTALSYVLGANAEVLRFSGTGSFAGTGNGLANLLWGGDADDDLHGGGGDDELVGDEGADEVSGGSGNDTFLATLNDGDDFYFGDGGSDTCSLTGLQVDAVVNLLNGSATSAHTGTDQLTSIENAICGTGNDMIIASTVRNVLFGGGGEDTFVFASIGAAGKGPSADVINDYTLGDRVDVSQIDANGALVGDPAFMFAGEITSVSGGFGQLGRGQIGYRYQTDTNGVEHTIIEGNTNANPEADFQIRLIGTVQLTAGDFLL
ncbi:FG-GAP-like repeat-containing protein [Ensifer sp. Root127]|uniref:beta strand repeat-containing protein n=1 Tax=Ensifer sp. Root127 TaxID=1736440 RepID=UPI00070D144B|nr:FG-GAP-like repeat-containing protein [Ensifer sp. Root127]KQW54795.1 hypothetical protein ASD03_19710 [Ensifer sp. Root127]